MGCLTCAELKDKSYVRHMVVKLTAFFEAHPCVDCGEDDVEVLTFADEDTIYNMIADQASWPKIGKQMNQREVICSNCRRRRIARAIGPWGLPIKKWE